MAGQRSACSNRYVPNEDRFVSQGELTGKETEKRDRREVGVDTGHGLSGVSYTASGINDALSMAIGHVRLGDLLKASGIISYEFLKEALSSF